MYPYLGDFPAGKTILFPFHAFNSSGASVTASAFAVADINVYKNVSLTQRSSTAGFTLIDTDGLDIDSFTGIHAFSIDTSDNTDSGFYAAGNDYTVVVGPITIDAQTVNFIAGRFSIENRSLTSDVTKWSGTAVAAVGTAGYPKVTIKSGTGTGEVSLSSGTVTPATGSITAAVIATDAIDADAMAADAMTEIFTKVFTTALTESYAAQGVAPTLTQFAFMILQQLQQTSLSGTTLTVKKLDKSTSAGTLTVNDATAPTSISRTT